MRRRLGILAALVAAAVTPPAAAHAAGLRFSPAPHRDAADAPGSPLDLTAVTFGQQETWMELQLRTAAPWRTADLSTQAGRALCLVVDAAHALGPPVELCVGNRRGRPALYADGRFVDASVSRPDDTTLQATFTPLAAGLPRGPLTWQASSRWTGSGPCVSGCVDVVPAAGAVPDTIGLIAAPRCFGAAARDPSRPCDNPALRDAVVPTPTLALITPNAPCTPGRRRGLTLPCAFGTSPAQARSTIALIGDSHAMHWRGALEVVAQAKRWRGLSVTHASCPFNRARARLPTYALSAECMRWNHDVRVWFSRHPEVRTVFVSGNARDHYDGDPRAGFAAAVRGLPRTVRAVFVLRDTPSTEHSQAGCVTRAIARNLRPGPACAQSRRATIRRDPQADAGRRMGGRVHVLDLNRFMCGPQRCLPVVGGALVRKDVGHLTRIFSATLGPYLLRDVDRALQQR